MANRSILLIDVIFKRYYKAYVTVNAKQYIVVRCNKMIVLWSFDNFIKLLKFVVYYEEPCIITENLKKNNTESNEEKDIILMQKSF